MNPTFHLLWPCSCFRQMETETSSSQLSDTQTTLPVAPASQLQFSVFPAKSPCFLHNEFKSLIAPQNSWHAPHSGFVNEVRSLETPKAEVTVHSIHQDQGNGSGGAWEWVDLDSEDVETHRKICSVLEPEIRAPESGLPAGLPKASLRFLTIKLGIHYLYLRNWPAPEITASVSSYPPETWLFKHLPTHQYLKTFKFNFLLMAREPNKTHSLLYRAQRL